MSNTIDLNLVDQIIDHIPHWTWPVVRNELIKVFVDNMTSDILMKLTGSPDDFDKAESILISHYTITPEAEKELIIDSIKILGIEQTVDILDSLKLDQFNEPTDNAPCSLD